MFVCVGSKYSKFSTFFGLILFGFQLEIYKKS